MVGRVGGGGSLTFYDTGRSLAPADFAEAIALQHSYFAVTGRDQKRLVAQKLYDFVASLAKKTGVIPIGKSALSDDGRILVTEPYFEEEVADEKSSV
jgi:hypothetical protein